MAVVTMRQLLESGVHFGHQTRRWNPKMKRYILTERNGIYIIDLQQSLELIGSAYEYVRTTIARGGTIMFVGTKKQAQEPIASQASRVGMPYVNQRWLGGMLTNFSTVHKRLQRLRELEELDVDAAGSGLTKKELLVLSREREKLERTLGGIRDMARIPSAVWIVDTKKEHLAVDEAHKLGIPVVAILDTNCDPDEVDFKIPGNDDAIRSVALLTRVIADAVAEGLMARSQGGSASSPADDEPLAAWERELLAAPAEQLGGPTGAHADSIAQATQGAVELRDVSVEEAVQVVEVAESVVPGEVAESVVPGEATESVVPGEAAQSVVPGEAAQSAGGEQQAQAGQDGPAEVAPSNGSLDERAGPTPPDADPGSGRSGAAHGERVPTGARGARS
jgi:small subunit ribosomal protein S2